MRDPLEDLRLGDDEGDWEPGPAWATVASVVIGLVLAVLAMLALFGRT